MKQGFRYQDEKSDKFWWIDFTGTDFAVNYGKAGTAGRYELKEFDTAEECEKQAKRLIAQKLKKGYLPAPDYDFQNHLYFDVEGYNLHPKTSHPNFVAHFTEELYYDCADEEAPFGSDEGSDALWALMTAVRENPGICFTQLPQRMIEGDWGMTYLPPPETIDEAALKQQVESEIDGLPGDSCILQSDQVILAAAFGQVKITGRLEPELKAMALRSLNRMDALSRVCDWDQMHSIGTMRRDLQAFCG